MTIGAARTGAALAGAGAAAGTEAVTGPAAVEGEPLPVAGGASMMMMRLSTIRRFRMILDACFETVGFRPGSAPSLI
jgi:hypothetical protein